MNVIDFMAECVSRMKSDISSIRYSMNMLNSMSKLMERNLFILDSQRDIMKRIAESLEQLNENIEKMNGVEKEGIKGCSDR